MADLESWQDMRYESFLMLNLCLSCKIRISDTQSLNVFVIYNRQEHGILPGILSRLYKYNLY